MDQIPLMIYRGISMAAPTVIKLIVGMLALFVVVVLLDFVDRKIHKGRD